MDLQPRPAYEKAIAATRPERMEWWQEARFGLFVHWGLYSLLGRNEWVMALEGIPKAEYEQLADRFQPTEHPARQWCRLAKEAGMNYVVMTTKHHEGYCLWDTKQTDYNAVQRGPGRDLVAEFVAACREYDLKIGFYYSLMDWHHPDGGACAYDPAARQRFLSFTHGCVRELMTNYGHIDILWYDVPQPFHSHEGWESLALNQMVRELQPHILINNRSRLDEDFSTPEGHVRAADEGRGWEACMTFNDVSWGWMPAADVDSWTPRDILRMLNKACNGGGNLLLNIGPDPEGNVPATAVEPLNLVGRWLDAYGEAVYGRLDRAPFRRSTALGNYSRKGNRVYFWVHHWPGAEFSICGFQTRLRKATLLKADQELAFSQEGHRIRFTDVPAEAPEPDTGFTVIALDFAEQPEHIPLATTPACWNEGYVPPPPKL